MSNYSHNELPHQLGLHITVKCADRLNTASLQNLKDSSTPAARLYNWNTLVTVINDIREKLNLTTNLGLIDDDTKNLLLAGDEMTCMKVQEEVTQLLDMFAAPNGSTTQNGEDQAKELYDEPE